MASYDYTSKMLVFPFDYDQQIYPGFDITGSRLTRGSDPDLTWMYRRTPPKVSSGFSGLGIQFYHELDLPDNQARNYPRMLQPTIPQFSGTVGTPTGVREVALCRYPENGTEPFLLEKLNVDVNGDFESYKMYPVYPSGEYFFRIAGDDQYSIKDFPVQPPVRNEFQWGKDNKGFGANTYDTAQNLRELRVEDTFTDTPATSLSSHTPDTDDVGTGWTVSAGDVLCGTEAYTTAGTGQIAQIETNHADVLIRVVGVFGTTVLNGNEHGIVFRYVDSNNYLYMFLRNVDTLDEFGITSVVGGTPTVLQYKVAPAMGIDLNEKTEMAVMTYQKAVWYEVNAGAKVWKGLLKNCTDHQSATRHGILVGGDEMTMDDFRLWNV